MKRRDDCAKLDTPNALVEELMVERLVKKRPTISKRQARPAIRAFFDIITETILLGGKVTIGDFGTFYPRNNKSKIINPFGRGVAIKTTPTRTINFRPFKHLKEIVNDPDFTADKARKRTSRKKRKGSVDSS